MKNLSAMFVALSLAGATPFIPMGGGTAYAQTQAGEVTGIVYDSNGEPLIGAVVSVKAQIVARLLTPTVNSVCKPSQVRCL